MSLSNSGFSNIYLFVRMSKSQQIEEKFQKILLKVFICIKGFFMIYVTLKNHPRMIKGNIFRK